MTEFPESALVRKTLTLREMDLPPHIQLTRRSLLRWFALAFGLINEKETRTAALYVLDALFYFLFTEKKNPTTLELQAFMKEKFSVTISEKLIRYHINKLIDLGLLVRKSNRYHINNAPYGDREDFLACFNYWVKQATELSMKNIETVIGNLMAHYQNQKIEAELKEIKREPLTTSKTVSEQEKSDKPSEVILIQPTSSESTLSDTSTVPPQ